MASVTPTCAAEDAFSLPTPTSFSFPFEPYRIQTQLMEHLYEAIEQRKLAILESPTGTGKSLSIICSSLSWLRDDRKRINDVALAALEEKLRVEMNDEPDWVLKQEASRKQRELLAQEEEIETRLQDIRAKEARAKLQNQNRDTSDVQRPAKRQRPNVKDVPSDDEFAPDVNDPSSKKSLNGDDSLPDSVQALLNKYSGPSAKQKVELEEDPDAQKSIFFTSRTHSQLSQFVGEIRKTEFANGLRLVPLGSRANLCINDDVRKAAAGSIDALNEGCTELQKAEKDKRCKFLPPMEDAERLNDFRDHTLSSVRDIEELAELGKTLQCCPYYGGRRAVRQAQLVTLPYNLLMQKSARDSLGISLKGHIVVVDEAHNLIDNILGIHTISLTSSMLQKARQALTIYIEKFKARLKGTNTYNLKQLVRVLDRLVEYCNRWSDAIPAKTSRKEEMKTVNDIVNASKVLDQINLYEIDSFLKESKIMRKIAGYAEKSAAGKDGTATRSQSRSAFLNAFYKIQSFLLSLANANDDGRILLSFERNLPASTPSVSLKYQLLNPSESFKDIVEESRSVVLAGGTMAPMRDFRDQLFSYLSPEKNSIFSCSHIVPREHIFARAVPVGPAGSRLELKFESKQNTKLLDDLGQALFNISNIVTKGVVCFCPSYAILELLVERWQASGLWTRLGNKKKIFTEPKLTSDVDKVLSEYGQALTSTPGGSLLLAVVGAKLSEGINFSNDLCRAVVVIGIPYPNANSAELKERMRYVDSLTKGTDAGKALYSNMAFKAVNQSIGRAIRHANDWSAIILLDARYATPSAKAKLPQWISEGLEPAPTFGSFVKGLAGFMKTRTSNAITK